MNTIEILNTQQNRHPLLFVDKMIEVVPGERASAIKCYTYNEWFFPSHFEDEPNVPGFVQVESLVQTFIMTFLTLEGLAGEKTNFLKMDNVTFKRKIEPGEVSKIEATLNSFKRGIASGTAFSTVEGEIACSAKFVVAVPSLLNKFKPR